MKNDPFLQVSELFRLRLISPSYIPCGTGESMAFLYNIPEGIFFQSGTPEFSILMDQPDHLLRLNSATRQEIKAVKKNGDRLIIKLTTNQAAIIRKIK